MLATVPSVQFFSAHPERRARKASPKSKGSVRMKPFFVYILHCIDGSYYVGRWAALKALSVESALRLRASHGSPSAPFDTAQGRQGERAE